MDFVDQSVATQFGDEATGAVDAPFRLSRIFGLRVKEVEASHLAGTPCNINGLRLIGSRISDHCGLRRRKNFGEIAAPSTHPIAPNAPIGLYSNPSETGQLQNRARRAGTPS